MTRIELWGDGAVKANGKPEAVAGWGSCIVVDEKLVREFNGQLAANPYPPYQSNNTGELTAIIEGLRLFTTPLTIHVYTDSEYVLKGATDWHKKWEKTGWKSSTGEPVRNQKLWKELLYVMDGHDLHWHHVKGHSGVEWNERCDKLAKLGVTGELVDNVHAPMTLVLEDAPTYIPVAVDFDTFGTDF